MGGVLFKGERGRGEGGEEERKEEIYNCNADKMKQVAVDNSKIWERAAMGRIMISKLNRRRKQDDMIEALIGKGGK